jgi:hypothetical protein
MSFGDFGVANERAAKRALAVLQDSISKLENELRVQKARGAPGSVLAVIQGKLNVLNTRKAEMLSKVKTLDARGDSALRDAAAEDANADRHAKQLRDALQLEHRTKTSQFKLVSNILAELRNDRENIRVAVFTADKARYGLERALRNRIERYQRGARNAIERKADLARLKLSRETAAVLSKNVNENIAFYTTSVSLDVQELRTLKAAPAKGSVVVSSSPAKLPKVTANLMSVTKNSVTLSPGATVPTAAAIQQLHTALRGSVPKRSGETETLYEMRIRRYTYRAAVRLANYQQRYVATPGRFTPTQLVSAAVNDTVKIDGAALEQESKSNVFAPAGEQVATREVDAATGAKAAIVPARTFSPSTVAQKQAVAPSVGPSSTRAPVPAAPSKTAASFIPQSFTVPGAAPAAGSGFDFSTSSDSSVAVTAAESPEAEAPADSATPTSSELPSGEAKPFWQSPYLWAGLGVVAFVGYKMKSAKPGAPKQIKKEVGNDALNAVGDGREKNVEVPE